MTFRVKVKVDGNQNAVIDALLRAGCSVQVLSQGMGVPDLLVAKPDGTLVLVEVKMPSESMTDYQKKWAAKWPTRIVVAHSGPEVLALLYLEVPNGKDALAAG